MQYASVSQAANRTHILIERLAQSLLARASMRAHPERERVRAQRDAARWETDTLIDRPTQGFFAHATMWRKNTIAEMGQGGTERECGDVRR